MRSGDGAERRCDALVRRLHDLSRGSLARGGWILIVASTALVFAMDRDNHRVGPAAVKPPFAQVFEHHVGSQVMAIASIRDAPRMAFSTFNGEIQLMELATRQAERIGKASAGYYSSLAVSRDRRVLAAGCDSEVQLWDAETYSNLAGLRGGLGREQLLGFSPDGALLAISDWSRSEVQVWDWRERRRVLTIPGEKSVTTRGAISPDGRLLAMGDSEGFLVLWDQVARKVRIRLRAHGSSLSAIAFSPDGASLVTASPDDPAVKLWASADGRWIRSLSGVGVIGGGTAVAFSPDGTLIAAARRDRDLRFYDPRSGEEVGALHPPRPVISLAFSADGRYLATGGFDDYLRLWDVGQATRTRGARADGRPGPSLPGARKGRNFPRKRIEGETSWTRSRLARVPHHMAEDYEYERAVAARAVRQAAGLCREVRGGIAPEALTKADLSPVTVADYGSQALICRALAEASPDIPVIAEEDSADLLRPENAGLLDEVLRQVRLAVPGADPDALRGWIDRGGGASGARSWTLDPIDGTKGFLRGEQYAVALALIVEGRVEVAALACPNLAAGAGARPGALFLAVRGRGASVQPLDDDGAGDPIRVSTVAEPGGARVCESVESGHSAHGAASEVMARLGIVSPPLRMDSQAKYAVVARGDAEVYLRLPTRADYREKIWDHAAGALIIEEAGGKVTDVSGRPLDFTLGRELSANRGVIVTNGRLHDRVLETLQSLGLSA